jgi:hypothetical protein
LISYTRVQFMILCDCSGAAFSESAYHDKAEIAIERSLKNLLLEIILLKKMNKKTTLGRVVLINT